MTVDKDTVMPEKWRNRFFKYVAGGDAIAGNIWHIAFVLIDKKGTPYYIGNDGAGKIVDLAETLEREFVRHEHVSWDHEFQEYDISSKEKVTELCKSLATYRDVCVQASVANMLMRAGYDGAGCTCTDCGEFFESSEYAYFEDDEGGGFHNCIDKDAYVGCGGLAVDMTRIVCDECRWTSECRVCCDLNIPIKKGTHEADVEQMDFEARFGYEMAGVCEYCWDRFVRRHDRKSKEYHGPNVPETDYKMERIPGDVRICDLLEVLEEAEDSKSEMDPKFAAELYKYFDWKVKVEGMSPSDATRVTRGQALRDTENLKKLGCGFARKFIENVIGPVAKAYFDKIDEYLMDNWQPHDLNEEWKKLMEFGKENDNG